MSTAKETLSLGMTFRNPAEIAEVGKLREELRNTTWTTSSIYLVGLRTITGMIKKAKGINNGKS